MLEYKDLYNPQAETAVITTLINHPDFYFSNDILTPHHFFDKDNGFLFYAISELIKRGTKTIDIYNITMILEANKMTIGESKNITVQFLTDLMELNQYACRDSIEEYNIIAQTVIEMAMRRDVYKQLQECQRWVCNDSESDIQSKIYSSIESIVSNYQDSDPIIPMSKAIDGLWKDISSKERDQDFIDFKFPSLNEYTKLSRTDCILFAAREKRGKSILLLNILVDVLRKGKKVLYIDTELPSKLFTMRLFAHLNQIDFKDIQSRNYDDAQMKEILTSIDFIKENCFIHEYCPILTEDKLIALTKQAKHKYGVDFLIVDYLKGNSEYSLDAYKNSAYLGKMTDVMKNIIAGREKMFVVGAVQATSSGAIADSQKIIRNCSTLFYLERKEESQIRADGGLEYGNMTMKCIANRNGRLSGEDESVSLTLDGNKCTIFESKQPIKNPPY